MTRSARAAALALLGVLAGCFSDRPPTGPEGPAGGGESVAITNFAYVPPTLSVASGTTVTWTNGDDVQHTVTADDGHSFESGLLGKGRAFQVTAPAPGTYTYHCALHPFMKGTLTVTAP
ncbi:MAG TPA: cupredoxin family copper-binding protein [Gemmatimonadales bacterium]|nr:cupredoxin family copper-binding protein [Gemmatimonadales bacterium]